jgi:ABC-type branched-subunit amino acid transport system substrate-binding protein
MTPEQTADLVFYLKRIGNEADLDPGLSDDAVRVGAALPMSGPTAQVGEDVKAALAAYFTEVNSQGGIYGRRFELVVRDSRGEPLGSLQATTQLIEQDRVFALVGSVEPGGSKATNEFLRRSEVPLVGPVTLSPHRSVPPNPYVFYLMPTFGDQARVLVDYVSAKAAEQRSSRKIRLAVIYARGGFDADALAGLKAQAKMRSMEIVSESGYAAGVFRPAGAVEALMPKTPDYIFFFGASGDILAFAKEMEKGKMNAALLTSMVMLGRGVFELPAAIASHTFMSYPSPLPREDELSEFATLMKRANVTQRHGALQRTAYAAAKVFVEAMKVSGRRASRARLITALEGLRDFRTGVAAPLTFGPNNRVGASGSYVVGIDLNKKQIVPLSEWQVPKERP